MTNQKTEEQIYREELMRRCNEGLEDAEILEIFKGEIEQYEGKDVSYPWETEEEKTRGYEDLACTMTEIGNMLVDWLEKRGK